jgi:transposase
MPTVADRPEALTAIQTNLAAIFVSMELSRSIWLITSLSPGSGEKMSKHSVPAGEIAALLARFSELKQKALARTGKSFPVVVIQEAGLDGFWIHRVLESEGIESHVVDPASIATSRRRRRAKTDRIDGEALLRALLAYKRDARVMMALDEINRRWGRNSAIIGAAGLRTGWTPKFERRSSPVHDKALRSAAVLSRWRALGNSGAISRNFRHCRRRPTRFVE